MSQSIYPVSAEWRDRALVSTADYARMSAEAVADPDGFWAREASQRIDWIKPFSTVKETSFNEADFGIKWFADGVLNVSANCLDRHLPARKYDVAILWEGDNPSESRTITYGQLFEEVCRFANALKGKGVQKGDRVTIYMPMIPEAAFRPRRSRGASRIAIPASSSPPTRGCAAARGFRSRPMSTKP